MARSSKYAHPEMKSLVLMGTSMNPTLKELDIILSVPYHDEEIHRGDVVLFSSRVLGRRVAHRVHTVTEHGLLTRGDNCKKIDSWLLNPDSILGRVVYANRGKRRIRIWGGLAGRLFAVTVRTINMFKPVIRYLLRFPYHQVRQSTIWRRFVAARVETRMLRFNRPSGTELQLLIGNRVIGRRPAGKKQWQIRPLFRLFIDEASLPIGDFGQ